MKYLIGIDGGGTKSECLITNLNRKVLLKNSIHTSNFLIEGEDKTAKILFKLIQNSLKKIKGEFRDVAQIVIGIAGAGRKEHASLLERAIKNTARKKKIKISSINIVSDALIALEGAFHGDTGCILIAGTGSIAFARDKKNQVYRVGGYGRVIGDEGGGYSIGKKALQLLSRQMDGRANETNFKRVLCSRLKVSSPSGLVKKVYQNDFKIASIARYIFNLAEKKDKTAIRILNDEADELVIHLNAIKKKLKINNLPVVFVGSLIDNKNIYSQLLKKKIKLSLNGLDIIKPKLSPAEGAILIAKRLINE